MVLASQDLMNLESHQSYDSTRDKRRDFSKQRQRRTMIDKAICYNNITMGHPYTHEG